MPKSVRLASPGAAKQSRGVTEPHRPGHTKGSRCKMQRDLKLSTKRRQLEVKIRKCFLILQGSNVKGASPPPSQIPHADRNPDSSVCLQTEVPLQNAAGPLFHLRLSAFGHHSAFRRIRTPYIPSSVRLTRVLAIWILYLLASKGSAPATAASPAASASSGVMSLPQRSFSAS